MYKYIKLKYYVLNEFALLNYLCLLTLIRTMNIWRILLQESGQILRESFVAWKAEVNDEIMPRKIFLQWSKTHQPFNYKPNSF